MNERAVQPGSRTANLEGLEIWRLCSQYTVVQAALLVVGHDPATAADVELWKLEYRPPGYEAAKQALAQALTQDPEMGVILPDLNEHPGFHFSLSVNQSLIWASSVKKWLSERGINTGFFFEGKDEVSGNDRPDYLNPDHPRYAPKLAAAVRAWQACGGTAATNGRSPKQALVLWLKDNAVQLGLVDKQGNPNGTGIEEVAKVANWQTDGGAPRTPGKEG
jgi:hypothetical protein